MPLNFYLSGKLEAMVSLLKYVLDKFANILIIDRKFEV